jgi:hypothetical protein
MIGEFFMDFRFILKGPITPRNLIPRKVNERIKINIKIINGKISGKSFNDRRIFFNNISEKSWNAHNLLLD